MPSQPCWRAGCGVHDGPGSGLAAADRAGVRRGARSRKRPAGCGSLRTRSVPDNAASSNTVDGLCDDPRPGVPRKITDADVEPVIVKTLEETPKNATHRPSQRRAHSVPLRRTRPSAVAPRAESASSILGTRSMHPLHGKPPGRRPGDCLVSGPLGGRAPHPHHKRRRRRTGGRHRPDRPQESSRPGSLTRRSTEQRHRECTRRFRVTGEVYFPSPVIEGPTGPTQGVPVLLNPLSR